MKLSIIHNAFGSEFVTVASYVSKKKHVCVALEEAYYLTNTIDKAWYENADLDIPEESKKGVRSTSTDDFIRVEETEALVRWYRVDSFGFEEVKLNDTVESVRYSNDGRDREFIKSRLVDLILDAELRDIKAK